MLEKNCNFGISMPIPVLISIKAFFPKSFTSVIEVAERQ